MAFVDQSAQTSRKTAIIGVTAIHAILGTALVLGLAGGAFTQKEDTGLVVTEFKDPPPPPPKTDDTVEPDVKQAPRQHVPPTKLPINTSEPTFNTTPDLPEFDGTIVKEVLPPGKTIIEPPPPPPPAFDPIAATPKNNPGAWVTTNDYRTIWINRGWTGTARFKVSVGTNGRVQNCQVISSTGHRALDDATCKLVTRRARFEAARGSNGEKVAGHYTTAVKWQLPR